ncbi:MAG: GNAT family N-acetyltransferase, partial [Brachybacterium alimentarium]
AAEVLGTARWDIHAAGLLLMGGRTLADARRLGLSAIADPAAEQFLDALLAGPRPSVLDAF